jgi:hypothetical protein
MSSCGAHLSNIALGSLYEAEISSGSNPIHKDGWKASEWGLSGSIGHVWCSVQQPTGQSAMCSCLDDHRICPVVGD